MTARLRTKADSPVHAGAAPGIVPTLVAFLAAAIPSGGAAWSARMLRDAFETMSRYQSPFGNGHGGEQTVTVAMSYCNRPALVAAFVGTALAGWLAARSGRREGSAPALNPLARLAFIAALAAVPAALLWIGETVALDAIAGKGSTSLAEATLKMNDFLAYALGSGLVVTVLAAIVAWTSWRKRGAQAMTAEPLRMPWVVATAVLLALTLAFAVRAAQLQ